MLSNPAQFILLTMEIYIMSLKTLFSNTTNTISSLFATVSDGASLASNEIHEFSLDREVARASRRNNFLKDLAEEELRREEEFVKFVNKTSLTEEKINEVVNRIEEKAKEIYSRKQK